MPSLLPVMGSAVLPGSGGSPVPFILLRYPCPPGRMEQTRKASCPSPLAFMCLRSFPFGKAPLQTSCPQVPSSLKSRMLLVPLPRSKPPTSMCLALAFRSMLTLLQPSMRARMESYLLIWQPSLPSTCRHACCLKAFAVRKHFCAIYTLKMQGGSG